MQLRGLHEALRPNAQWALDVADYYGIPVEITSVERSWSDQQKLYDNYVKCVQTGRFGREPGCMYPANRPGDSAHQYGLAWDSWVPEQYREAWKYIRRYAHFEVPDHDWIHAQLPNWRSYV
jgi:hypothetical protein